MHLAYLSVSLIIFGGVMLWLGGFFIGRDVGRQIVKSNHVKLKSQTEDKMPLCGTCKRPVPFSYHCSIKCCPHTPISLKVTSAPSCLCCDCSILECIHYRT